MKPYITMEEVIQTQGADSRTHRFLTEKNGCTNGCASGTTIYASTQFSDRPGVHEDQEGFYVLEGEGYDAQILEFIDMEHTPKNILIRAIKTGKKKNNKEQIERCREFLQIHPTLGELLQ